MPSHYEPIFREERDWGKLGREVATFLGRFAAALAPIVLVVGIWAAFGLDYGWAILTAVGGVALSLALASYVRSAKRAAVGGAIYVAAALAVEVVLVQWLVHRHVY